MSEELVTALKDIDFDGKIIRPFITHEGSGLGSIPNQIKRVCKGANVLEELAIKESSASASQDIVEDWI